MRKLVRLFVLSLVPFFLLSPSFVLAQNTYAPTQPDNMLTPGDPIGIPPHTSTTGTHEAINLTNGGLNVFIPVLSLPQRGGENLTLGYFHNSINWSLEQDVVVDAVSNDESGLVVWGDFYIYDDHMSAPYPVLQANLPTLEASIEYIGDMKLYNLGGGGYVQSQFPVFCAMNWVFTDWSGNRHPFLNRAECSNETCPSGWLCHGIVSLPTNTGDSTDGSWLYLDTTNKSDIHVITKHGTVYHFTGFVNPFPNAPAGTVYLQSANVERYYQAVFSTMVDTNGNSMSLQTTQSGTTIYNSTYSLTDTIGRSVSIGPTGVSYKDSNGQAQTISLNTTVPPNSGSYSFPGFSCSFLGTPPYQLPFQSPTITTGQSNIYSAPFTMDILFPPSDSMGTRRDYHMQFDVFGRMGQITYPSGGYTKYDYQTGGPNQIMGQVMCAVPFTEVAHKRECPSSSGGCSASQELVTTYAAGIAGGTIPGNGTMDETDPLGALTQHVFGQQDSYGQIAPRETATYFYSYSGTLLRTIQTAYTAMIATQDQQLPTAITTTLNDVSPALSSVENRQYQVDYVVPNGSTFYYDNPIEIDEYGYNGSVMKQTAQTWEPSTNFTPPHILDRLASRTVTDPVSSVQSTLSYGYNTLGNVTSKIVGGTSLTNLSWSYLRDPYGNLTQITDPKNNVTKFAYTDSWNNTNCAPSSNSSAYLTSITDALTHVTTVQYDSCTGLKALATDPNGAQTTWTYDALGRNTLTTFADGGQTSITFVDALPNTVTTSKLIEPGLSLNQESTQDGFGRGIQSQVTTDPDGPAFVATTYDAVGRKATVSNPYRTSNDPGPTNGTTTYQYDALSRVTQVAPPDGTVPTAGSTCLANNVCTSYAGNTTTTTDQAGKARESQTDALGRLSSVWEDPNGNNYLTNYSYDAFGNLTCVEQHGTTSSTGCSSAPSNDATSTWRVRRFTYDALSRLLTAYNPESGTISYAYDANGNLLTKTSPAPNQTVSVATPGKGSVTITGSENCASGTCDQGTVSITVDGYKATTSYGSGSSTSSIASALTSGLNGSGSPVTARSSGSIVNITSAAVGASTNYSLSASSSSGAPLHLSKPSFGASPSGSALTGGATPPFVTLSYCYDALNRVTGKAYTAQTCANGLLPSPLVSYFYDQTSYNGLTITNGIGRRTGMQDQIGFEAWSFDPMGRVLTDKRTTNFVPKITSYVYLPYVDGSVNTITYPSSRTMNYNTGGAGRLLSVQDNSTSTYYANYAHYAPPGGLSSLTNNGSALTFTAIFNSRLQPCWIYATTGTALPWNSTACTGSTTPGSVIDLKYNFNLGVSDNGNVSGIVNDIDATRSQTYTYDSLNRISTAQTQTTGVTIPNANCWGLTFGYDPWGNLLSSTITGPSGCSEPLPWTVTSSNSNQISGYCYDAAGNLLIQSTCPTGNNPAYTYVYDVENHLTSAAGITYSYDGDGKRVQKSSGKLYWYGAGSDPLDETDLAGDTNNSSFYEYIFIGGQRIARRDYQNNVYYYFTDHLGTSRVVTNSSGTVLDNSDFYPFGVERPILSSSGNTYKFTGKERDAESGLDNFGARYNASPMGRFMTPDPLYMNDHHLFDPQQLNLYSYVRNNPLTLTDPTGLDIWLKGCDKNDKEHCHKGYVGTWDKNHKHFTRTHLSGDQTQSATLDPRGVTVKYNGGTFQGVWDTNKGESNPVQVAGGGALKGFTATINGNCNRTCGVSGFLSMGKNNLVSADAMAALGAPGSGYQRNAGFDVFDTFHRDTNGNLEVNFRGYLPDDAEGLPSTHVPVPVPGGQGVGFHVDNRYPYEDVAGFAEHTGSVVKTIIQTLPH